MHQKFSTIFFDLDGTLADNYAAITLCIAEVLKPMGITPPSLEKVKNTVGGSILITFEKLIGKELAQTAAAQYQKIIGDFELEGLKPMPYSLEILEMLKSRGVKTAMLTNKGQKSAENIARHLGFDKFLSAIFGTELNGARKPEKEFTLNALRKTNTAPWQCAIIGDSPYDYLSAKSCGIASMLVATGADDFKKLQELCPGAQIFADLRSLSKSVFE